MFHLDDTPADRKPQQAKDPDQFIVFARIKKIAGAAKDIDLYSNRAFLFTYSRSRRSLLFFNVVRTGQQTDDHVLVDNIRLKIQGNDFFYCLLDNEKYRVPFVRSVIYSYSNDIDLKTVSISDYLDYGMD